MRHSHRAAAGFSASRFRQVRIGVAHQVIDHLLVRYHLSVLGITLGYLDRPPKVLIENGQILHGNPQFQVMVEAYLLHGIGLNKVPVHRTGNHEGATKARQIPLPGDFDRVDLLRTG